MANITLGASYEVAADQSGVPAGAIRLASGSIYKTDSEGRPMIPQAQEAAPVVIHTMETSVLKTPVSEGETGEVAQKETTQTAVDSSTGATVAEHKVVTDDAGKVIKETKSGDVSVLGVTPDSNNVGGMLLGLGIVAAGAYFMFKG